MNARKNEDAFTETIIKNFADILDDLIAEKKENTGLTNNQIAEEIRIPPSQLSKYRNADLQLRVGSLVKISKYFGVTTDYLLGLSKLKSPNEDYKTVHKVTGLSDKAIQILQSELEKDKEARKISTKYTSFRDGINMISFLIEHEQDYSVFKALSSFLWFKEKMKKVIEAKQDIIDDDLEYSMTVKQYEALQKVILDEILMKLKEHIENECTTGRKK